MQSLFRPPVKNTEAVVERLEDIKLDLPFVETLAVVAEQDLDIPDIEDDLKREVEFYNQALNAVKAGRKALDAAGVVHMRPIDFMAEMVKSDDHMGRVKQHLLFESQKMESFEKRKQQKEYKKYSKQLQSEKQKEKSRSQTQSQAHRRRIQDQQVKPPTHLVSVKRKIGSMVWEGRNTRSVMMPSLSMTCLGSVSRGTRNLLTELRSVRGNPNAPNNNPTLTLSRPVT